MKRVLFVDDEPAFLQTLADGFKSIDSLTIFTAPNGEEAREFLDYWDVDLVVTDLKMPKSDGFQLLAHMSRAHPNVPTIVMTAYQTPAIATRSKDLGARSFIEKPIDFNNLVRTIFEVLSTVENSNVRGISLASFLQLLEMERKDCVLEIWTPESSGRIELCDGKICSAQVGSLADELAVFEMLSWEGPAIEMSKSKRIGSSPKFSISYLLMEHVRLLDEREAERAESQPLEEEEHSHATALLDLAFGPVSGELPSLVMPAPTTSLNGERKTLAPKPSPSPLDAEADDAPDFGFLNTTDTGLTRAIDAAVDEAAIENLLGELTFDAEVDEAGIEPELAPEMGEFEQLPKKTNVALRPTTSISLSSGQRTVKELLSALPAAETDAAAEPELRDDRLVVEASAEGPEPGRGDEGLEAEVAPKVSLPEPEAASAPAASMPVAEPTTTPEPQSPEPQAPITPIERIRASLHLAQEMTGYQLLVCAHGDDDLFVDYAGDSTARAVPYEDVLMILNGLGQTLELGICSEILCKSDRGVLFLMACGLPDGQPLTLMVRLNEKGNIALARIRLKQLLTLASLVHTPAE